MHRARTAGPITFARTREIAALLRSKAALYLIAKGRSGAIETFNMSVPAPISNSPRLNQAVFGQRYQRLAFHKGRFQFPKQELSVQ
jgi:hypothetical protein